MEEGKSSMLSPATKPPKLYNRVLYSTENMNTSSWLPLPTSICESVCILLILATDWLSNRSTHVLIVNSEVFRQICKSIRRDVPEVSFVQSLKNSPKMPIRGHGLNKIINSFLHERLASQFRWHFRGNSGRKIQALLSYPVVTASSAVCVCCVCCCFVYIFLTV